MDTGTFLGRPDVHIERGRRVATEESIAFRTSDGVMLRGRYWHAGSPTAAVIVNAATGVQARYYHRYASFLAQQGFDVLTYDYRGIGESRPASLKGCMVRWRDWGEFDFDAALLATRDRFAGPICVVGHSIGGILPGLASGTSGVHRMLTVGAQYAWWPDYASGHRAKLVWKWHVLMPLLTAMLGYFPGRRLGWLEDLPKGVANEWSFRRARIERSFPAVRRADVLGRFRAVRANIMAVAAIDDEYATQPAVRRGLSYFENAARTFIALRPGDLGVERIGHFDLFHARHMHGFWRASARWLATGINPWPHRTIFTADAGDSLDAWTGAGQAATARFAAWKAFSARRTERQKLCHLLDLNDYLLDDVGLTRDEVRLYMQHRGFTAPPAQHGRTDSLRSQGGQRIGWPHDGAW
ncbi:alpha/beta fold hydrolase [Parapusillimonas sp. SGNA-6]|nr:alpha/beta fold hydrolase [Parapusillimonas sp. SGNA-6]